MTILTMPPIAGRRLRIPSQGEAHNSVTIDDVRVTLTDDDTKGVTISETTLAFGEASSGSYTVKLNSQPTQDVTVTPASGNTGVAEVSAPLLFHHIQLGYSQNRNGDRGQ